MIPNHFPDGGESPEYNSVDATFWFAEAVKAHWRTTGDRDFLALMYPVLAGIVAVLQTGTRYGIRVDADGLIRAGEPGVQLTWMDAKVGDWVVTPRIGTPIEVNALWLSTLTFLAEIAPLHGADASAFAELHARARAACERYWNPAAGYAFDVIDGPDGNDPTMRPNPILAARASAGFFDAGRRRAIVEACSRTLLTPVGLRSLAPDDPSYRPRYSGDQTARRRLSSGHRLGLADRALRRGASGRIWRHPRRRRRARPTRRPACHRGHRHGGRDLRGRAAPCPVRMRRPSLERRRDPARLAPDRSAPR
jgi:predicted glycogen debranching enzyme